jgi:hypothetical protein
MKTRDLVTSALLEPESALRLSVLEWDLLIRQGRRANLLASLAHRMKARELLDGVPLRPQRHLISALRVAERQDQAMRREVQHIQLALDESGIEPGIVLLKGVAYIMADLPTAGGRMFSDIDILAPREKLAEVESQLMQHGWQGAHHDAYDQRYYRRWMHEIPPMRHIRRGSDIDVHHTILPGTARLKVDTPALFRGIVPLRGEKRLYVLNPVDMLLHSATHLFHEGHFDNGLRDLFDLDSLFRHFGKTEEFWSKLVPRAAELGLMRPLHYAVRFCTLLLATPIPADVVAASRAGGPGWAASFLMDWCYLRVLRPPHASCDSAGAALARLTLYIRSHWMRMPFPLLACHLARKALLRMSWKTPCEQR